MTTSSFLLFSLCFFLLLVIAFLLVAIFLVKPVSKNPIKPKDPANPIQSRKLKENNIKLIQKPTITTHRENLDNMEPRERSYSPNVYCPHGVEKVYFCAICDEEKFRDMTGIDFHNK